MNVMEGFGPRRRCLHLLRYDDRLVDEAGLAGLFVRTEPFDLHVDLLIHSDVLID